MALRLGRGVIDRCQEIVEQIQMRHIKEPGVAQSLYEVLLRFGLINSDGTPAISAAETEPEAVLTGGPAAQTSEIWTPDSNAASSQGSEGKSKLWLPGQS